MNCSLIACPNALEGKSFHERERVCTSLWISCDCLLDSITVPVSSELPKQFEKVQNDFDCLVQEYTGMGLEHKKCNCYNGFWRSLRGNLALLINCVLPENEIKISDVLCDLEKNLREINDKLVEIARGINKHNNIDLRTGRDIFTKIIRDHSYNDDGKIREIVGAFIDNSNGYVTDVYIGSDCFKYVRRIAQEKCFLALWSDLVKTRNFTDAAKTAVLPTELDKILPWLRNLGNVQRSYFLMLINFSIVEQSAFINDPAYLNGVVGFICAIVGSLREDRRDPGDLTYGIGPIGEADVKALADVTCFLRWHINEISLKEAAQIFNHATIWVNNYSVCSYSVCSYPVYSNMSRKFHTPDAIYDTRERYISLTCKIAMMALQKAGIDNIDPKILGIFKESFLRTNEDKVTDIDYYEKWDPNALALVMQKD
jgi:hypothetical protein